MTQCIVQTARIRPAEQLYAGNVAQLNMEQRFTKMQTILIASLTVFSIRSVYHYFIVPIVEHNRRSELAYRRLMSANEQKGYQKLATSDFGRFSNGDH